MGIKKASDGAPDQAPCGSLWQPVRDVLCTTFNGSLERMRLVVAGCADGEAAFVFAPFFGQISGFDRQGSNIKRAQQTAQSRGITNANFALSHVLAYNFGHDVYAVLDLDELHQLSGRQLLPALQRIAGALRPGGLLITSMYTADVCIEDHRETPRGTKIIYRRPPAFVANAAREAGLTPLADKEQPKHPDPDKVLLVFQRRS